MAEKTASKGLSLFERYLTLWVMLSGVLRVPDEIRAFVETLPDALDKYHKL